ncbi:M48 family metallopeptidase [Patescibacteria group bacterium]|nr:M48 family metallopeptidase [Patescibacteria group bacterium]
MFHRRKRPRRRRVTKDYLKNKEEARVVIVGKVEKYNDVYNYQIGRISIRNQKTRWGSCSKHGNLNFSYKVLFLPEELADYIIVHELCHLQELNHSQKFWDLVAQTFPNYKEKRRQLRSSELTLLRSIKSRA